MKNLIKNISKTLSLLILIFLLPHFALSQRPMTMQELVDKCDVIVNANIISNETHFKSSKIEGALDDIYTLTKFKILQTIKGYLDSDEWSFDQEGGRIGNSGLSVTHQVGIPTSGEVILFLRKHPHKEENPLEPLAVGVIIGGKTWSEGKQLDAVRFIEVLKRASTDPTALPTFYEEIGKEEEVRNEAYKKGFGLENIEQIRKHDPDLANKIETMKLEPWILPSGL